ncbi:hypothetical protein BDM02DRAFT_3115557 [Thelephora ganbajun]|uniref:Uncharacterized protein n=1 Tax=Thelephora ganbajun TaxID=370292 RepID=A0ACB6ZFL6_THEGA|nr:hypothetical protein BDM02DRAFT_3115557 [Thelephora ganbajun]
MGLPVNHPHPTSNHRKRILMLHGYAQNATTFSRRMAAVRKACADEVEMVFIDAPHVLNPVDLATNIERMNVDPSEKVNDPTLTPRGWWAKADTGKAESHATGLKASLEYLRDYLAHEHFDAVFGFSQGASMSLIVSIMLEKPHLYEPFLIDRKPVHPRFEYGICVGAFIPFGSICETLFATPFNTPFLHIYGKYDVVVLEERTKRVIELNNSSSKRVESHIGGHFVPISPRWKRFFIDYIRTGSANPGCVLSPSASSKSLDPVFVELDVTNAATPF